MRSHVLIVFLLLAGCVGLAQTPLPLGAHSSSREPARIVVNDYCRLDYQGSRLAKDTWPRVKALTTWKDNPDWQGFTIVSQYEVSPADEGLRSATVNVQYSVLGHFDVGLGFFPEQRREDVWFLLKNVDSSWKIDAQDPPINPHVSKLRAISWLKASLATEKDPANKIALQKALKDLGGNP